MGNGGTEQDSLWGVGIAWYLGWRDRDKKKKRFLDGESRREGRTHTVKAVMANRVTIPHLNGVGHSSGLSTSPSGSNSSVQDSMALPIGPLFALSLLCSRSKGWFSSGGRLICTFGVLFDARRAWQKPIDPRDKRSEEIAVSWRVKGQGCRAKTLFYIAEYVNVSGADLRPSSRAAE